VKTTLEDIGPWQKAITITLEPGEVDEEMDQVVARYRQKAVIPGFRKGKVPEELVRVNYRSSIESDLLNHILPEATGKAIEEHGLLPAAPPEIKDLTFHPGEALTFVAVVELWPRVEVQGYRGLELEETILEVDEEMVQEVLEGLRERAAEFTPVFRRSVKGDVLEAALQAVDLNGQRLPRAKRETVKMEAGGESLLPEFREASLGREPGSTTIVHIQYPADFQDPELAGRQRHYQMQVRQILDKKLPDLDDEFARRMDGIESLEALKSRIRLRLEAEERLRARSRLEDVLIDRLIAANPFDLPAKLIDRTLRRALEKAQKDDPKVEEEEFRRVYAPVVERVRRREILLDSVARAESIEVGEEELLEEIRQSVRPGVDPLVVKKKLEEEDELDQIRSRLLDRKTFDFLFGVAVIHRVHQPRPKKSNLILP
jgi:trigger factor